MAMTKPNDSFFYLNSVRNQVVIFMSLFKSMKVVDEIRDNENTITETKEVPIDIIYAPQERKLLELLYEYTNPSSKFDKQVPMFSVSISSIVLDETRSLNFYRKRRIKQNSKQYNDRMPIPYNIGINLAILAKYEGHVHQIMENIVPYFGPYIIVKMKENTSYLAETPRELRIDFDGTVNRDIPIQWNENDRRIVKSDLNFIIRGWIYKPITASPGPILHIPIKFFNNEDFDVEKHLFDQTEVIGPNWNNS